MRSGVIQLFSSKERGLGLGLREEGLGPRPLSPWREGDGIWTPEYEGGGAGALDPWVWGRRS